jgi:macrodomain Ter protein organizer (MatP/YcbG family)
LMALKPTVWHWKLLVRTHGESTGVGRYVGGSTRNGKDVPQLGFPNAVHSRLSFIF